jgi:hypothetical protein
MHADASPTTKPTAQARLLNHTICLSPAVALICIGCGLPGTCWGELVVGSLLLLFLLLLCVHTSRAAGGATTCALPLHLPAGVGLPRTFTLWAAGPVTLRC